MLRRIEEPNQKKKNSKILKFVSNFLSLVLAIKIVNKSKSIRCAFYSRILDFGYLYNLFRI